MRQPTHPFGGYERYGCRCAGCRPRKKYATRLEILEAAKNGTVWQSFTELRRGVRSIWVCLADRELKARKSLIDKMVDEGLLEFTQSTEGNDANWILVRSTSAFSDGTNAVE